MKMDETSKKSVVFLTFHNDARHLRYVDIFAVGDPHQAAAVAGKTPPSAAAHSQAFRFCRCQPEPCSWTGQPLCCQEVLQ
jgi:hypothetical protein